MELIFNKTNQNVYEAVFEAPADFNLHIERKSTGSLIVKQGITADGEFADAVNLGLNAGKIINSDFAALVYPKFIKVVSGSEVVKVFVTCPDGEVKDLNAKFVDLGLPSGIMWATCNVGATKPEEIGLYFASGEIEGYTAEDVTSGNKAFVWNDYKFGTKDNLTKYNKTDKLTTLELEDDAVYQNDNAYRLPTKTELEELIANTTSTWETLNGVNGRRFTSKTNGNSIFIPATGFCREGLFLHVDSISVLWSSSVEESMPSGVWQLSIDSNEVAMYTEERNFGVNVRGVLIN